MQVRVAGLLLLGLVLIFAPFADWQYAISAGSDIHSLLRGFGNASLHTGASAAPAAMPEDASGLGNASLHAKASTAPAAMPEDASGFRNASLHAEASTAPMAMPEESSGFGNVSLQAKASTAPVAMPEDASGFRNASLHTEAVAAHAIMPEDASARPASSALHNVVSQEAPAAPPTSSPASSATNASAGRGRWDRFFEEKWQEDGRRTGFRLAELRGPWPGQMRFATALLQDLPDSLARSKACDVIVNTGWKPALDRLKSKGLDGNVSRVWLLINQEPVSMQDFWKMIPRQEVRRAVMVGNWWNKTHAEVADKNVSSIWLPFGSSYLADLPLTTPLDLQHRKNSKEIGVRGEEIRKQWSQRLGRRRSTVVYQQGTCWTNVRILEQHPAWENYREKFWDTLNQRMKKQTQDYGYAAGRCNGILNLGHRRLPRFPIQTYNIQFHNTQYWYRFHEGLMKYSWFRFVVALENTINMSGYISEKVVQALLAGAVPIFAGAAEAPEMLNERSYVLLTPGETENQTADVVIEALLDEGKYAQLWQEDAVSDEQLRRFFSWHPAVWPSHGDSLRRRIVSELNRLCQ